MVHRPRIRDKVHDKLDEIAEQEGYSTTDEVVTYLLREAGYNV